VLLLDEADTYAKESEEIRGIINAGHRADGAVIRNVGDNFEPRTFDVFSPVVACCNRRFGDQRSSIAASSSNCADAAPMSRSKPCASIAPPAEFEDIGAQGGRWAADHSKALGDADPAMPTAIWNARR